MMVLPGCSLLEASEAAERMRRVMLEKSFDPVGHITGSFGVTEFKVGDSVKTLLRRADRALYRTKAAGRNRVETCTYDDAADTPDADAEICASPAEATHALPVTLRSRSVG